MNSFFVFPLQILFQQGNQVLVREETSRLRQGYFWNMVETVLSNFEIKMWGRIIDQQSTINPNDEIVGFDWGGSRVGNVHLCDWN